MTREIHLSTPLRIKDIDQLVIGDKVFISGVIYTARDTAHKMMMVLLDKGEPLPFDISGQIIYYVGPTPAQPGRPVGSAGPTTSYRMDAYASRLIEKGLKGMIGKGPRSSEVIEAMKKWGCVYFGATGGAGALLSLAIKQAKIIAFEDLGTEAVRRLEVKDFPVVVINDIRGNDLYQENVRKYQTCSFEKI
ncbi:MAG: fumarate hydratase [Deltaproteobacteria bacterium]|nr:fumarate hydratase [Deltaproteobacteria bacterium]MBP1709111.1 fumarate hydratase [Deltaproteobacteria bacterium]